MTINISRLTRWTLGAVAIAAAGVSCRAASTAARDSRPVAFHVRANTAPAASAASSGALDITSVRIVVGGAALGGGDQYGCVDCLGNDGERSTPPLVVAVPLDGSAVLITTERVNVGTYSQVEISLDTPASATLAANPTWSAGTTIEVAGRYRGTPFVLPLTIVGSLRQTLSPPIDVTTASTIAPIAVHLTLPVASWFTWQGTTLDPGVASQRAQIAANASASFPSTDAAESPRSEP